jgi:hypothetical protein
MRQLRPSENCLNCGHAVATRFCPECGQENTSYRVSLGRLIGDLFEELFQLESRLWRTLWALFRRPGLLTREYNAGRRVAYTTPLRLYIIASVAYFFVGSIMPGEKISEHVQFDLGDVAVEDAKIEKAPPMIRALIERAREARKDPQGTVLRVRHTVTEWAPRIAAFLVPLLAFLTWLFFRRPKLFFVEHLVFALHAHATAFLLLLVGEVLHWGPIGFFTFLAGIALVFLALRRVFAQSRLRTGLKLVVIGFVYSLALGVIVGLVAAWGFFARG